MKIIIRRSVLGSVLASLALIATSGGCSASGQDTVPTGAVQEFVVDFARQVVAALLF